METIVTELRVQRGHAAKTIAIGQDGSLFVNIGAPSNACQERDRQEGSPGQDPCPLLEWSGGIWRFDARRQMQRQSDGERWATGLRNMVALTVGPDGRTLWGVQHGRDLLSGNWGRTHPIFTDQKNADNPAEELFRIDKGGDYGWPYCYYDVDLKKKVLAPEYGGDGTTVGRCANVGQPLVAFPGHWAPEAMVFYTGNRFPAEYRGGAFVSFHGSWNRAPLPQAGFNVAYVPFENGRPTGSYVVFADGFRGAPNEIRHRPMGLAVAPDGSLVVTDDQGGRIYRIMWRGR
jgi:glucose/arabinose dehydrogenase